MEQQNDQKNAENPREKANFLSIITFFWTIDLFRKGYKKDLEVEDLYKPLKCDESEKLGDRLEKNWNRQINKSNKRPSLIKAITKTFWREYLVLGVYEFINDIVVRLSLPLFLGRLLDYFSPSSNLSKESAFFNAGMLIALNALSAVTINQFLITSFSNGMKVRLATCSLIYRKSLRLSSTALGNTSVGKVVNLLSNDVSRFDIVSVFLHCLWLAPLLTIAVGVILYLQVGSAGLIGMLVIAVVTPLQSYTGKLSSKFRLQTAIRSDERIRLMDEIINGIQVIKLYAWEKSFKKLIGLARIKELKVIKKSSYVRALYMTFMLFTTRSALYCTMMAIVVLGDELTASKVFVISSLYQIISSVLSQMFVRGIAEIAEAIVAMRRLQNFLEHEEKAEYSNDRFISDKMFNENGKGMNGVVENPPNLILSMDDVCCRWKTMEERVNASGDKDDAEDKNEYKLTLNKINLKVQRGKLVGILGHVGAGKSSLLQTILRELPIESGKMFIKGKISFAPQEAWVFSGSIRQNILFGCEMDKDRYDKVVTACALNKDFEMFPHGDLTLIGERGSSLSGGQKARLSLARSLYRDAELYLFDDPLSAVDAHVGKHLFEECLSRSGFLGKQHSTRILVTHQVHFLKDADWLVLLKDGKIEKQGFAHEILQDEKNINEIAEEVETFRRRSLSRSSSNSSTSVKSDDKKEVEEESEVEEKEQEVQKNVEESSKGKIKGNVAMNYLKAGGNTCKISFVFFLFLLTQAIASASDYFVGFWTHQEEMRRFYSSNSTIEDENSTLSTALNENEEHERIFDSDMLVYFGGILIVALFFIAIFRSIYFYTITIAASKNLHKMSFNGVVSTKMRFFDLNPSGRILNRFSKDLGAIDEWLAKCLLDAVQVVLMGVGSIVVTAIINPLFLIPIAFLFIVFSFMRKYFLKTSKNLKRLEGITKSLAYVHLAATINGLSTIRAFGAQDILKKEFDQHQNSHTGAWFMYINVSQAFGFTLDVLCMIFVCCVTLSFVIFDAKDLSGASVGLAITQSMALTMMLQWGIRQSAEVMNQMMAVERVLEYRELEPEQKEVKKVADKNWPAEGKIEFKNVVYRYAKEIEPALKGITFTVNPGDKVGIVGRTGAGKSSLIGSLFRIAEIEGEIIIDGIDTSALSLEQLRSKISIIPQDPVLFSGTMRKNLDPFDDYQDDALWKALEDVKLKEIEGLKVQGLQSLVAAGGSNFSVGQRQLICLARAILRQNKILVLDEATANVDPETDGLIQQTIREKFVDCTVLTIAHRLHTVMDSDKIIVMNFGKVAEYDTPENLLKISNGIFKSMINAAGSTESKNLIALMKKNV
ncbi:probable multidrug resistance-associated protein lethal(2)03659 [Chironomus tepperi]|uniref:probable multidrug resistance-associated protein lethal(2)03659 n=1 Tax=Chironomus tepperi TaxID=113505 RepID=UPI00391EE89A